MSDGDCGRCDGCGCDYRRCVCKFAVVDCLKCGLLCLNCQCDVDADTDFSDDAVTDEVMTELSRGTVFSMLSAYLGDRVFAARFLDCMDIIRVKNVDYSQGEDKRDRVAAFRRIAKDVDITMKQAWAVFAGKHWGAIMKFVKDGWVESEAIDGRINDLINYCVLLGAIVDSENDAELTDELHTEGRPK